MTAIAKEALDRRNGFLRAQKAFYSERVQEIRARFNAGLSGWDTVRELSDLLDETVNAVCRFALEAGSNQGIEKEIAVCALGGYGRRESCPRSDVDVMFLYEGNPSERIVSAVSSIFHLLIDMGFEVGHSFRSIQECLYMARRDHGSATSMVEGRILFGDADKWDHVKNQIEVRVFGRNSSRFVEFKKTERDERLKRFGRSIFQTEPNIKENAGSLRDYHYARWIAQARFGSGALGAMVERGALKESHLRAVDRAVDFLLRVRCQIHFRLGKHDDVLNINLQGEIARDLGYEEAENFQAVELFMKDFYFHSRTIFQFVDRVEESCLNRKPPTSLRLFGNRIEQDGFFVAGKETRLIHKDGRIFRDDPLNLLKAFRFAQKYNAPLGREALEIVGDHSILIDDALRSNPDARNVFFSVMKHLRGLERALRDMHETHVLDLYLPEFGMVDCLMQHDMYHSYTVDEHTIVSIGHVERLLEKEKGVEGRLKGLLLGLERPERLTLGLLFHDIGKVNGNKGHVERGEVILDGALKRMDADPDTRETLMFLLKRHLAMSHLSQRRESFDDKIVRQLVDTVSNFENLNLLTLLTYADIKAVGPNIYSEWKGELLWQLYLDALRVMEEGAGREIDVAGVVRQVREKSPEVGQTPDWENKMSHFLDVMPTRYLHTFKPAQMAFHERIYRKALRTQEPAVEFFHHPEYTEIIIATPDRPHLYANICAAASSNLVSIFRSAVFTSREGIAFDVLCVYNTAALIATRDIWGKIRTDIVALVEGTADPEKMILRLKSNVLLKKKVKKQIQPRIVFDNESSDDFTIVDTYFQDKLGLLYLISHSLSVAGLNIYIAKIATEGELAINAFYVKTSDKRKILEEGEQERVRQVVLDGVLGPLGQ